MMNCLALPPVEAQQLQRGAVPGLHDPLVRPVLEGVVQPVVGDQVSRLMTDPPPLSAADRHRGGLGGMGTDRSLTPQ